MANRVVHILVVDDENRIRKLLKMYLERENYIVSEANNGRVALEMIENNHYDIILLDLMLPGIDGLDVASDMRRRGKTTPIIMLTAKGDEVSRIEGFEAGADDYVVKPFSPKEMIKRIQAVLRRTGGQEANHIVNVNLSENSNEIIEYPDFIFDNHTHQVFVNEEEIILTPKEYDLLLFLVKSPNVIFNREQLLRKVWGYEVLGDIRTVDTHIKRIREKISKESKEVAKSLVTVWGMGYKFNANILAEHK